MSSSVPPALANLDGQMMPLSEVRISALDRGFLFGDAVYEVLRVYGGKPWLEEPHFQRLARSLREIRLTGVDLDRLRQRMRQTLEASKLTDAIIYIQVTRGSGPRSHPFPEVVRPLELLWVQEFLDPYVTARERGTRVITQPDLRWGRCDIKSTNLLGNVLAMQAAREAGCHEALFYLPDGTLTEGTHTNLFGVADGTLLTYPSSPDVLPGITRALILQLAAKAGVPVAEHAFKRHELDGVQELFVSGTTSEIMPVVQIDERMVGAGLPGPVTRRLQEAYRAEVARFVAG